MTIQEECHACCTNDSSMVAVQSGLDSETLNQLKKTCIRHGVLTWKKTWPWPQAAHSERSHLLPHVFSLPFFSHELPALKPLES